MKEGRKMWWQKGAGLLAEGVLKEKGRRSYLVGGREEKGSRWREGKEGG